MPVKAKTTTPPPASAHHLVLASREITAEDVSEHYDELDGFYRRIWGENVHHGLWIDGNESRDEAVLQLTHEVAVKSGFEPGQSVCDVGCGYGAAAQAWAEWYGVHVKGFTISEAQYEIASRRTAYRGSLSFELRNWHRNQLPTSGFDHVAMIESSEHSSDKAHFFSEAFRVLKPGGTMAVCCWLANQRVSDLEIRSLLGPICNEGRMPGLGTFASYSRTMEDAGFVVTAQEDWSEQVKKTWSIAIGRTLRDLLSPAGLIDLSRTARSSADFALSLLRIRLAYETGAIRYGFILAEKI
jgi:tocopherol O-methyltransferase